MYPRFTRSTEDSTSSDDVLTEDLTSEDAHPEDLVTRDSVVVISGNHSEEYAKYNCVFKRNLVQVLKSKGIRWIERPVQNIWMRDPILRTSRYHFQVKSFEERARIGWDREIFDEKLLSRKRVPEESSAYPGPKSINLKSQNFTYQGNSSKT